ncbi:MULTISPECIES: ribonuclease P protein component [unclassified Streptococcus]|uniref:ribonuclease P protein component n=1 Tax=unclassified Streptococcus TaxID=2608887 RepID=UPI0010717FD9|nr:MULTISPECIES: ribonuclease P protein component [unclassified Streptococcus]MBF0787419.1 ribonuclease P protein component [Streptococcus sp. 19428wC2_LYSM12]MCQ9211756.1 ribonuclease P protein component [Streptococcus sp. B01]MCQ9213055.1 ribonuclease P protein component [Streptococcus sp. O1]TFV05640.1 ribonuclease P protein component [Streptococcus sp. LYSM12]
MKKTYRVKRERDFNDIFTQGKNIANRKFVIYRLAKEQTHFRVGLSVSKKLGNAVTRNGIKRKIRHVLMECAPYLVTDDFVVIARKGVEELSYQEIKQNLLHVLKLAKLYQEGVPFEKES